MVELVEINHIHRRAEFQIIIDPTHQGKGYAGAAAKLAMEYGFSVLNLYKLYLIVDKENEKAIHIYSKLGFEIEGELKQEFFINGEYRTVIRMCIFQPQYLAKYKTPSIKMLNTLGSDGPNCFFPLSPSYIKLHVRWLCAISRITD